MGRRRAGCWAREEWPLRSALREPRRPPPRCTSLIWGARHAQSRPPEGLLSPATSVSARTGTAHAQLPWFCKAGDDRGLISFRARGRPSPFCDTRWAGCDKVAGYARAWARTSDLGRKTMAGGVCYLTTHTPATSSFVPDLPASATSSPRPPDIACLFPESVALGQDARPRSGVRPRAARGRAAFRARRWLRGSSRAAKAIS